MKERMLGVLAAAAFLAASVLTINLGGDIAWRIAALQADAGPAERPPHAAGAPAPGPVDPAKLKPAERELYERIVREAKALRAEPIDARNDPVWKAIPGLNGLEVDIDATFRKAAAQGATEPIPFVFREIPARVTLDDLGPLPIYKGNPRKPMVALMINVAWKEENLPDMLRTLREENVKATFFLLGAWLKDHPEEAKAIAAEGHEIGNHAYWHKTPLSLLSAAAVRKEIADTQQLIKETLGTDSALFAPPAGDYSGETVRIAAELGLRTILWTLDTIDWKEPPPASIVRKIRLRAEPGSLILMHPTESSRRALRDVIREVKSRGLALGTVSETISPSRLSVVEPLPGF